MGKVNFIAYLLFTGELAGAEGEQFVSGAVTSFSG